VLSLLQDDQFAFDDPVLTFCVSHDNVVYVLTYLLTMSLRLYLATIIIMNHRHVTGESSYIRVVRANVEPYNLVLFEYQRVILVPVLEQ